MAQAFVRIGLAVGQSLSLAYGDDLADVGLAELTAAAVHMAEAAQLVSTMADKVAPLVDQDSGKCLARR
jgi:3-deoxy-D-manno-octulosonate 8-phosphate phosphatase KdsC-like HAD superfamily phosphatase